MRKTKRFLSICKEQKKNIHARFARSNAIDIDWLAIRRLYTKAKMRRNGSSSSLVHPVWPTGDGWTFTPSEGNASSRDIESRFGAALSPRRHIWAVFFGTGCLIWYRREPLCERGLVLRRIEAAGRADVTRSSSFRYKSQFYTSLSTDRKTSPYMAEQYDSFVDCDPQEPRARGRVQVFHTDPYTVIIITNGWLLIPRKLDRRGILLLFFNYSFFKF